MLAEHTPLSLGLARAVFVAKGERWSGLEFLQPDSSWSIDVEWRSFAQEYPELAIEGPAALTARLAAQLRGA